MEESKERKRGGKRREDGARRERKGEDGGGKERKMKGREWKEGDKDRRVRGGKRKEGRMKGGGWKEGEEEGDDGKEEGKRRGRRRRGEEGENREGGERMCWHSRSYNLQHCTVSADNGDCVQLELVTSKPEGSVS